MSLQQLQLIKGRIITESDFRSQFFDNPDRALADYDLTPLEQELLKDLSTCPMTKVAVKTVGMRYRYYRNKLKQTET